MAKQDLAVLVKELQQRIESKKVEHEKALEHAQTKYEKALQEANEEMKRLVDAQKDSLVGTTEENSAVNKEETDDHDPAAAWIVAPDGEKMMVINQQAVVMFLAIFDRMANIAKELQKLSSSK